MTVFLLLLTAVSLPVSACGIKPNSLEAPPGAEQDTYPRTYPAPAE